MNIFRNKIIGRTGSQAGFTLVEMIVSLAIFSVVAVIALGALMKIIDANIKAQSLQAAVTNLNFALDTMSRELRTGSTYDCQASFGGTSFDPNTSPMALMSCSMAKNQFIAFYSTKTDTISSGCLSNRLVIAYYFSGPDASGNYTLYRAQQNHCTDTLGSSGSIQFSPVISTEVSLTDYRLAVSSNTPYPLAFVRLSGFAGAREKDKTYFDIQTAASPRIP